MLEVLYFSQRDVKAQLFARVDASEGVLLVTAVRHNPHMRPVAEREPFRTLERRYGDVLHQVVVADEGTLEGMWRDPVGDLSDRLFPDDRAAAYAASSGYLILAGGEIDSVLKKRKDPVEDLWFLQEALAAAHPEIPRPDPAKRPLDHGAPASAAAQGSGPKAAPRGRAREEPRHRPERPRAVPPPVEPAEPAAAAPDPWSGADPYALLGIARGSSLADGKKIFRSLITQYHPDKVSHLAPEFRVLAEQRTRQIVAAWEAVEPELE